MAFTLALGLSAFGVASAAGPAPAKSTTHVAKPVKSGRAKSPPAGAKLLAKLHFNTSIKWKTDPKSHSVFAVGEHKELWFIDPTSGWPYTINAKGYVYTADPTTGSIYGLGKLSKWVGPAPYFFTLWDYVDGSYRVPAFKTYLTIYDDSAAPVYTYDTAYTEVWEYQDYFSSEEFSEETVDTTEEVTEETTTTTEEHHETSASEEHGDETASEEHHEETASEEHEESAAEEESEEDAGPGEDDGG
jgi:hypothetical protein